MEDAGHYMCQCPNDLYAQVRKAWYKKVIKRVKEMSMKLWEVFIALLRLLLLLWGVFGLFGAGLGLF